MSGEQLRIEHEAAAWLVASGRDDMDWDGFTRWLESDPRHRLAYDELALADALVAEHADLLADREIEPAGNVVALRPRRRWPMWLGGGIAASLAALMIVGQVIPPAPEVIESGVNGRTVALGPGSTVTLAPRSRLTIGGRDGKLLALEGTAFFDIKHDPSRLLEVTAGNLTVTDVGTRFDVSEGAGHVRVAVADGEVAVRSERLSQPIQLTAGRRLAYDPAASQAVVSPIDNAQVGEWRAGRLTYDAAPLQLVAADLGRYAGVEVTVPRAVAERRFSGTLFIGDGESAIRDLAQLMDLELRRDGSAFRLEPGG